MVTRALVVFVLSGSAATMGCGGGSDLDGTWFSDRLTDGRADRLTIDGATGTGVLVGHEEKGLFTRSGMSDSMPLDCPVEVRLGPEHSLSPGWHDLRFAATANAPRACLSFTDVTKCGIEGDRLVCAAGTFHQ